MSNYRNQWNKDRRQTNPSLRTCAEKGLEKGVLVTNDMEANSTTYTIKSISSDGRVRFYEKGGEFNPRTLKVV